MVSAESQAAMESAKKAVLEFMKQNGRHDTTVHERVAPAVYHETISRIEHEELVTVIEREISQDHYHTSVQPITDSETVDEQHHHNDLPVENRHFEHDDIEDRDLRLAAERDKFRDEVTHIEGEKTQTVVPTVTGEHIHHHVHEIIQPVVNKHTIEPHVVHSTVFIREIHHNAAKHHTLSALPAVTMAEFKRQGGVLVGREERWDSFEGEPRSVGGTLGTPNASGGASNEQTATHAAASTPSAPARRSSLAPEKPTQSAATDKPLPAPPPSSAQAVTEARKQGESPAATVQAGGAGPSARPGQQQQQQQQGRWSLLPMHLARSAGDGQQLGHPPLRAPLRVPQAQNDGRQGSVANKPGQQQQDQQNRRAS